MRNEALLRKTSNWSPISAPLSLHCSQRQLFKNANQMMPLFCLIPLIASPYPKDKVKIKVWSTSYCLPPPGSSHMTLLFPHSQCFRQSFTQQIWLNFCVPDPFKALRKEQWTKEAKILSWFPWSCQALPQGLTICSFLCLANSYPSFWAQLRHSLKKLSSDPKLLCQVPYYMTRFNSIEMTEH